MCAIPKLEFLTHYLSISSHKGRRQNSEAQRLIGSTVTFLFLATKTSYIKKRNIKNVEFRYTT